MTEFEAELKQWNESGCKDCGKESLPQMKVCDVCKILDGNTEIKLCKWCETCNAWICEADLRNWIRRGKAFFKR